MHAFFVPWLNHTDVRIEIARNAQHRLTVAQTGQPLHLFSIIFETELMIMFYLLIINGDMRSKVQCIYCIKSHEVTFRPYMLPFRGRPNDFQIPYQTSVDGHEKSGNEYAPSN